MNNVIRYKRFTQPRVLQKIGRQLLHRLFEPFAEKLQKAGLSLPSSALPDNEYYQQWAGLLLSPEGLPDDLNEALFAIEEMATSEGLDRLQSAIAQSDLKCEFDSASTPEDLALQLWLAAPELLARKHNEQRLLRLTAFTCYAGGAPSDQRSQWAAPTPPALDQLVTGLDSWFAAHYRGRQTTRVELYPIHNEHWFLVRHGDTYTRSPAVEGPKTEILHFRPERDDVVVYSPEHDEIRINTRTKGERDLYREQFGLMLRGSRHYFSEHYTYTLDPLRTHGADALDPEGLEGICKIVLRELEVAWDNGSNNSGYEILIRQADDVFRCGSSQVGDSSLIPPDARLTRAAFDLHFTDSAKPRPVQIRPPNFLKLGRHCDLWRVDPWLCARGFRTRGGKTA
jgi:hypothetical protein